MTILTVAGLVDEAGQVQLAEPAIVLPPKTQVYVVVPGLTMETAVLQQIQVYSPRLRQRQDVAAFMLEQVEEAINDDV